MFNSVDLTAALQRLAKISKLSCLKATDATLPETACQLQELLNVVLSKTDTCTHTQAKDLSLSEADGLPSFLSLCKDTSDTNKCNLLSRLNGLH